MEKQQDEVYVSNVHNEILSLIHSTRSISHEI